MRALRVLSIFILLSDIQVNDDDQKFKSVYLCHPRYAARNVHARLIVVADIIAETLGFPVTTPSSI